VTLRNNPWVVRAGVVLIAVTLAVLPFALAQVGTAWVRITNYAVLYVLLALGLNIVVGYAGLLDLGYVAFFGFGGYNSHRLALPEGTVDSRTRPPLAPLIFTGMGIAGALSLRSGTKGN